MNPILLERPGVDAPAAWAFPAVSRDGDTLLCNLPGRDLLAAAVVFPLPLAFEPPGIAGVAPAALSCLTDAAPDRDGVVLSDRVEALGGTVSVAATHDGLRLAVTAAASRMSEVLLRVKDTFAAPRFDLDLVARVLDQRRSTARSLEADPAWRARAELRHQCVHAESRWALPDGGTAESLTATDADATMAMAMRLSQATRPVLVVSGDVADRDLIGPGGAGDRLTAEVRVRGRRSTRGVVVDRPGAVQTCLAVGCVGVDRADARWADLSIASCVLGGAMWSRLEARLREEKGYTYGVQAGFGPWRRAGLFSIRTAVESSVTGPALADLLATVRRFVQEGVSPAEHRRATDYLLHSGPLRFETSTAVTEHLAELELAGLLPDEVDRVRDRLRASTPEQVDGAFRSVVDVDSLVVVAVGDATSIEPALRAAGVEDVEVTT